MLITRKGGTNINTGYGSRPAGGIVDPGGPAFDDEEMSMHMKTSLAVALCLGTLTCAGAVQAQTATETWRLGGFKSPESVIFDKANNRLIVSNMTTFGAEAGADGFLSVVSPEGKMVTEQWVTSLHDPKGMAIVGDRLFVADSDGLVEIGLGDGAVVTVHPAPDAKLLNDVATDGTDVYVSDLVGQAIYRLSNGSFENWLSSEDLHYPNGLLFNDGRLILGSMGTGMQPDFSFTTKGGLQLIDIASKSIVQFAGASELSQTDGVARIGDWLIFDDNPAGVIYAYADDKAVPIATLVPGAADLYAEGNMLYVPLTQTGELVALTVE